MNQTELDVLLVQIQFPGMTVLESNVLRAWIREYGREYDSLEFQVRLGKGQEIQPGIDAATAGQFDKISKRRADVIAHTGTFVDILEIKDRGTLSAMGQLIAYRQLWTDAHPTDIVRRMIIVSPFIDQDVQRVYTSQGFQFYILQPEAR